MPNEIKALCETVLNKSLFVDGKKMRGVRAVVFTYDVDNTVATATLVMHIKRGSVAITDSEIRFDTPGRRGNEAETEETE